MNAHRAVGLLAADLLARDGVLGYAYDLAGLRTSMTLPNSQVFNYAYDGALRLTSVARSGDSPAVYAYDTGGRRTSLTLPNGVATAYAYDTSDRLTSLVTKNSSNVTLASFAYTVDSVGNRTAMAQELNGLSSSIAYGFDSAYRLTSESRTVGTGEEEKLAYAQSFAYDAVGNRTRMTATNAAQYAADEETAALWHFDEGDSMSVDATGTSNDAVYLSGCASVDGRYGKGLALDGESYAQVNDDPALELGANDWTIEAWAKLDDPVTSGEVVSKWADGGNWSWKIEITSAAHVMLSLSTDGSSVAVELVSNAALSANEWVHIAATCDATNDIVSLWINGVQDVSTSFDGNLYDGTAEVRLGAGFDGILDEVRISNADRSGELGETETLYTYNERNQLVESHDPTSTSVIYYSYDLNGNTTRIQSMANSEALFATTMNYDTLNRCTEINSPAGVETMAYRGSEWHRYAVTANGTTTNFLYDGDNVVADLQSSAIVKFYNTPFLDQNLAMYNVSGETITPYYYTHDGLGSVRTLMDSNEVLQNAYDYYAFGGAYAPSTVKNVEQRYTYTGRETTQDPSLMYYRYRIDALNVGRFLAQDPLGIPPNYYVYASNNPLSYRDPSGQVPVPLFIGAAIAAGIALDYILDYTATEAWHIIANWLQKGGYPLAADLLRRSLEEHPASYSGGPGSLLVSTLEATSEYPAFLQEVERKHIPDWIRDNVSKPGVYAINNFNFVTVEFKSGDAFRAVKKMWMDVIGDICVIDDKKPVFIGKYHVEGTDTYDFEFGYAGEYSHPIAYAGANAAALSQMAGIVTPFAIRAIFLPERNVDSH